MSLELELWAMNSARISELEAGGGGGGSSYTKAETDELLLGKVDAVEGKGLSTNDYSDADKSNVDDIPDLKANKAPFTNTFYTYTKSYDFNDMMDGMHFCQIKSDLVSNKPTTSDGMLIQCSSPDGDNVAQLYLERSNRYVYARGKINGAWNNWSRV